MTMKYGYNLETLGVRSAAMMFGGDTGYGCYEKVLISIYNELPDDIYQASLYLINQEGTALVEEVVVKDNVALQGNDTMPLTHMARRFTDSDNPVEIETGAHISVYIPLLFSPMETIGLLVLSTVKRLPEELIESLKYMAKALVLGIKHILLSQKAERARQLVRITNSMSSELQSLVGSETLLDRFVNLAAEQLGFDRASLFVFHEGEVRVKRCVCHISGSGTFEIKDIPPISLISETSQLIPQIQGFLLPLKVGSRQIGALLVDNLLTLETPPYDSIDILQDLCGQVALSCENTILIERLRVMAIRDDLTNLYRRGYFFDRLQEEISKNNLIALITVDMDYFKRINDTYGHLAGDELLVEAAGFISTQLRCDDIACRMGGDEFLILLKGASSAYGFEVAERILNSFKENRFMLSDGQNINISISAGVANYPEDASNLKELFRKSDEALYFSKRNGRGRVSMANCMDSSVNLR